jgi:predicted site-specific integrase-resolvase
MNLATLYRWILAGRVRAWRKPTSRYLVSRSEVLALLEPVDVELPARRPPAQARNASHEEAVKYLRSQGFKA